MGGDYAKADDYFAGALADIVNEIKILSSLSESGVSNIVRYYENDIIETQSPKTYDIYIMMEFLTPFTDYAEANTLTVKDAIGLGKDILRALAACHHKNIIHRDIKDDNIFVSPDGAYKLGDFGVSKALKDKSRAESVKGTPNFIAPEVYLGKEKYDHTVDLYSLGIVLYKLLNKSRNPFMPAFPAPYTTADEDAAFEARMTGKIPEPPLLGGEQLGRAVLKAIMPRAERYNSAVEFLQALESAEASMSDDELSAVICQAISLEGDRNITASSEKVNSAANETFGMGFVTAEPSAEEPSDRHLFDTFAAPSAPVEAPAPRPVASAPRPVASAPRPTAAPASAPKAQPASTPKAQPAYTPSKAKTKETSTDGSIFRKIVIFGLPPILLTLYVAFFMILLPILYGQGVSFITWLSADIGRLGEIVTSSGTVFPVLYLSIFLIIVQYILLGSFILTLVLACKELHRPKKSVNTIVKYTGKTPILMLDSLMMTLKNDPAFTDRATLDTLRMTTDSLRYSKPFGHSKSMDVVKLENEMCRLIDAMQENASADPAAVASDAALLKQKSIIRDTLIKR